MEKILLNKMEFTVLKLLGHGKGGYSYLVESAEGKKFVLKQIHHEPCDYYNFGDKLQSELSAYQVLKRMCINVPTLYEVDYENERLLKEYIEGETIVYYVKNNLMKNTYYEQILNMARICNEHGHNLDYYPTNFIVCNDILFYIDYEVNEYSDKWNYSNWGSKYWSKTVEFCRDFDKKD